MLLILLCSRCSTKAYVDTAGGAFLPLAGGTMSRVIDMGNHKIINITHTSSSKDAVNLEYLNTQLALYLPLSGGARVARLIWVE